MPSRPRHAPTQPKTSRRRVACSLPALAGLIALAACGGGAGSSVAAPAAPAAAASSGPGTPGGAPIPFAAPWGQPKAQARVFISGHSLTDNPLGDQLVAIANGLGGSNAAKYNQQIVIGSPIRVRTEARGNFSGYSAGKNRSGSGMNVINELRSPATLEGDRYDTLVIAENHNLLSMLQWEDTVRNLRHFHERLLAGNAAGRSYFYETWFGITDKADPRNWIAHERAASGAWQCVAARVNHSLAAEGRNDRITPLPVGAALAELVERATQTSLAGISGANTTDTLNRLFSDDVHLTSTGMYYAALVTYAAVYQRSPEGAPAPSGMSSTAARSLQQQAWSYVSNFYASYQPPSLESCRTQLAQNFCPIYWSYRGQPGNASGCTSFFSAASSNNPLHYAAGSDASYWYPAPP